MGCNLSLIHIQMCIRDSYNNGKCDDCGATKPSTECEHNWKIANDNTYHWNECTKCGEIKDKAKHTMTAWKDNGLSLIHIQMCIRDRTGIVQQII